MASIKHDTEFEYDLILTARPLGVTYTTHPSCPKTREVTIELTLEDLLLALTACERALAIDVKHFRDLLNAHANLDNYTSTILKKANLDGE